MASESSSRLWRANKQAGRPWPKISDDDVIDFMVMEAISLKVQLEDVERDKKARKEAERKSYKDTKNPANFEELNKFR